MPKKKLDLFNEINENNYNGIFVSENVGKELVYSQDEVDNIILNTYNKSGDAFQEHLEQLQKELKERMVHISQIDKQIDADIIDELFSKFKIVDGLKSFAEFKVKICDKCRVNSDYCRKDFPCITGYKCRDDG